MKRAFLLTTLTVIFFCLHAYSLDSNISGGEVVNGLQLTIKANKETYVSGEPIIIEYTLKNVTEKPLIFYLEGAHLLYALIDMINIVDKEKQPVKILILYERPICYSKDYFITLKPKDTWSATKDITAWYHTIRYPGKYEIIASYLNNLDYYNCQGNPFGSEESVKRLPDTHIDAWTGEVKSNSIIVIKYEGETSFVTPKGRINLGMDIKEVKEILGIKDFGRIVRRSADGTEEIEMKGYSTHKDSFCTISYRFYDRYDSVVKSFEIFLRNDKVIDWKSKK